MTTNSAPRHGQDGGQAATGPSAELRELVDDFGVAVSVYAAGKGCFPPAHLTRCLEAEKWARDALLDRLEALEEELALVRRMRDRAFVRLYGTSVGGQGARARAALKGAGQ